ncbi:MAG TPA: DUF6186 family protein [Acidimicrobiales bacterium]
MKTVTMAGYAVVALWAVGLEIAARRSGRVATLGAALCSALRWRPVRGAILAGWLWLGWHVFVRASWP